MSQPIQQGGRLGRYQLITRLATGGMAEVWLGRATGAKGFQKTIVVKTILPHLADDPDFLRMFIDEALLAAALNHPNIVQIFDLGQIGDHYFIAMEYILGRTMRQVQRVLRKQRKVMPPWLVLRVAVAVCDALDYAHNRRGDDGDLLGIVHRDVTPENIMISFSGVTKVVDFGIAKATTGAVMTRAGKIKGKLAYLAPEQIVNAEKALVDRRTDIYALGVVLYEMLTGVRPFRAPNDMALLLKIPKEVPTPPCEIARWVPTRLSNIVMRAMAKDAGERFQEARDLGEDLETFLTSVGTYPTERHVSAYMCKLFGEEERRVPLLSGGALGQSGKGPNKSIESSPSDIHGPDSAGSISIEVEFGQKGMGPAAAALEDAVAAHGASTAGPAHPSPSTEVDIEVPRPNTERTEPRPPTKKMPAAKGKSPARASTSKGTAAKSVKAKVAKSTAKDKTKSTAKEKARSKKASKKKSASAESSAVSLDDLGDFPGLSPRVSASAVELPVSATLSRSGESSQAQESQVDAPNVSVVVEVPKPGASTAGHDGPAAPSVELSAPASVEVPRPTASSASLPEAKASAPAISEPQTEKVEAQSSTSASRSGQDEPSASTSDGVWDSRSSKSAVWDSLVARTQSDLEDEKSGSVNLKSGSVNLGTGTHRTSGGGDSDSIETGTSWGNEKVRSANHAWDLLVQRAEEADQEREEPPPLRESPPDSRDRGRLFESGASRREERERRDSPPPPRRNVHMWDAFMQNRDDRSEEEEEEEVPAEEERAFPWGRGRDEGRRQTGDGPWNARKQEPTNEAANLFDRGLSLVRDGEREAALRAWERAVELDPDNRRYQSNLRLLKKALSGEGER
jgi:serine/threonine protein kinase